MLRVHVYLFDIAWLSEGSPHLKTKQERSQQVSILHPWSYVLICVSATDLYSHKIVTSLFTKAVQS